MEIGYGQWVSLFHFFIVAPLLLAVGILGSQAPGFFFTLLIILGAGALIYHGWKLGEWAYSSISPEQKQL